jgi:hypothetical protein
MGNVHKDSEHEDLDVAMDLDTALDDGSNTPVYFSMAEFDLAVFEIFTGTLTGAASLTCTIWETDGTTPQATTITTTITEDDGVARIQIRGEQLDVNDGYYAVGILVTETENANAEVGVLIRRKRARFKHAGLSA